MDAVNQAARLAKNRDTVSLSRSAHDQFVRRRIPEEVELCHIQAISGAGVLRFMILETFGEIPCRIEEGVISAKMCFSLQMTRLTSKSSKFIGEV